MVVPNIIKGFDVDCHLLMVKFEQLNTVRFSEFAKVWKEMNFSLVFNGRRIKELVCFTSEALSYVKYFFISSNSFLRKISALYIIYALYYKQPIQYRSKISVILEEWLCIKEIVNDLKENGHIEALVILLKLIYDNAFEYSITNHVKYMPTYCGGTIHTDYNALKKSAKNIDLNFVTADFVQTEDAYKKVKQQLIQKKYSFVNYASDNLSKEFKEILIADINKIKDDISDIVKPSTSKSDYSGTKRRKLKQKCFQKKARTALHNSSVFKIEKNSDTDDSSD